MPTGPPVGIVASGLRPPVLGASTRRHAGPV